MMLWFVSLLTLFSLINADNTGNNGQTINTTVCMFEDGLCGWTNDRSESSYPLDWSRITHNQYSYSHDHTIGTGSGHFMSFDLSNVDTTTTVKLARISSPVLPPAEKYCVQFYYSLFGRDAYPIKVYAREFGGLGYPVLTLHPNTSPEWTFAQVDLDSEYTSTNFQVVIEGASHAHKEYHFGSYRYVGMDQKTGIDDVYITNTKCGNVPKCPKETYMHIDGDMVTCLYFNTTATSWTKAVRSCRLMSPFGHLVSVESLDKQKTLISYIDGLTDSHIAAQNGVWTSGTDSDLEGHWIWASYHANWNYTDWKVGQPNNVGSRQDCLALDYPQQSYSWGDEYCGLEKPFICQMTYNKSLVNAI